MSALPAKSPAISRKTAKDIFSYPKYWAECLTPAPYLPMSRREMDDMGWDSCDIIFVTGDAYVDHPSFAMGVCGRFLEAQGFRVGIISQPNWRNTDDFLKLGLPNLFFAVAAGNMDSMINHYTAEKKRRNDDAYTAGGEGGKRPDRAVTVYSQRCKQIAGDIPVVIGGIEASLRRIAQYDYWSDQVRRSVLVDSTADMLLYGNGERSLAEVAHGLASGKKISEMTDIRGSAIMRSALPEGWTEIDSSRIDWPGHIDAISNPYYPEQNDDVVGNATSGTNADQDVAQPIRIIPAPIAGKQRLNHDKTWVRLPSFAKVNKDPVLYAHASRVLHLESNPHNAHVLVQKHDKQELWVNPPPIPLETSELDRVFELPYQRQPHPSYGQAKIPAFDMIRFSVNIMRGCFGGCTFCSITEHEGRIIQSRSQESVVREIEQIRDKTPGFTGHISDLGGPTANMYHLNCKSDEIQSHCRKLSCVYPTICENLITNQKPTTELYRKARKVDGVHTVSIASGLRYDLAVRDPEYVKELVTHHVGGYLKIAPEHTEGDTLNKMMKPGMDTYYAFKQMFDKYSKAAGKKQYLIPYFIAAHPGCEDEDMVNLALWLKRNDLKVDQVQTFYPSPMSLATAMYHSHRNPLKALKYKKGEQLYIPREKEQRTFHKAILRYHDPANHQLIKDALIKMHRKDLIGDGASQLIDEQPEQNTSYHQGGVGRKSGKGRTAAGSKDHFSRQKMFEQSNGQKTAGKKSAASADSANRGGNSGQSKKAKPSQSTGSRNNGQRTNGPTAAKSRQQRKSR
ncbi:YgiQ family radical SAM protein [Pelagibaculum spongiae]|uniref:YgiQ family radical SAM protein n=1 Tax=Pelagibaculum spongiae TaxID=2080658 RepID=A0A2V1GQ86_9GAMM|nr:YgiQ family radical SAM protein [Pelagibaculum spongiae]PVZ65709.1 YgiQ family radical SAM protein [Pelagibaculum spongiae]